MKEEIIENIKWNKTLPIFHSLLTKLSKEKIYLKKEDCSNRLLHIAEFDCGCLLKVQFDEIKTPSEEIIERTNEIYEPCVKHKIFQNSPDELVKFK